MLSLLSVSEDLKPHPFVSDLRAQWSSNELASITADVVRERSTPSSIPLTVLVQTQYLEEALGEPINGDLFDALRDGQLLCALVNLYFPKAHTPAAHTHTIGSGDEPSGYAFIENITFFLCFLRQQLRMPADLLFDANDLFSLRAGSSDVLRRNILLSISLFAGYVDACGAGPAWLKHRGQIVASEGDRLHLAIRDGRALLKPAAGSTLSSHGWTSLYSAAWYDRGSAIAELTAQHKQNPNAPIPAGFCPLHAAAYRGACSAIEALCRAGALRDVYAPQGQTPLFFAVAADRGRAFDLLLRLGARVDGRRDSQSMTPLHGAVDRRRFSLALRLLAAGADASATFHAKRYSVLHLAVINDVQRSVASMVPIVVKFVNTDVNVRTAGGHTPLMLAAMHGLPFATRVLLEAGADAAAVSAKDHTALEIALRNGNNQTAQLLATAQNMVLLDDDDGDVGERRSRIHALGCTLLPPSPKQH